MDLLENCTEQQAELLPLQKDEAPTIERKYILKKVPSGEIRVEAGSDGLYLAFDCDCLDALPICQAQCCYLNGIGVRPNEEEKLDKYLEWDYGLGQPVMIREADAGCTCLDRRTKRCTIYEDRPQTCHVFHCTRGARTRGWKLSNRVHELPRD